MSELVSVIIPVYNKELFIEECLCSVINQSYKKLQIIVIDDGSTDSSLEIIKKMAMKDMRIEVIAQENHGRSKARNRGIDLANGEYIAMVDADDSISEDYVFEMVNQIEKECADCVVCGMNIVGTRTRKVCIDNKETDETNFDFIYKYIANNGNGFGTSSCNKLFRRKLIYKNEIYYRDIEIGEDYLFCLEYAWVSKKWSCCNKALYNYIQNNESTMHTYGEEQNKKIYKIYDELVGFANERNIYEQLKNAIATSYIKFIFKEALNISYEKERDLRNKRYKEFFCDEKKKVILAQADLNIMSRKYKIFYYIYMSKNKVILNAFISVYKLYSGGVI